MAPLDELLKDPEYTNWVKSGLALTITNAVLRPFVVEEIKKLHQSIVRTLPPGASCGGCRVNTGCQNGICNKIQLEIEKKHWYPNPTFKNTCTGRWSTEPWEIAKCYMSPSKRCKRSSASDADFSACINVIINCKHFQNFGTSDPNTTETVYSESRDFRNEVMHSISQKVSEQYMEENLDILINILNKIKTPETEDDTNEAIEKIQKIKANQLTIKLEDVIEVRRTATEANADKREKQSEQVQRERLLVNFEAGCRKALCRLTEEHISKQEESDEKLSVSAFLSKLRMFPERKDLGSRHKDMLFPTSGTPTDIGEWDLFVYCFILELELYEPLENAASLFVQEVKKIRDELLLDATGVTEDDLSELCEYLIDTDLNTEITEIFKKDSPDVDVIRSNNNLVAWWRQEEEYGNKPVSKKQLNKTKQDVNELEEKTNKRFAEQEKKLNWVIEKLEQVGENVTFQGAGAAEKDIDAECKIRPYGCDVKTEKGLQKHITNPNNNDTEKTKSLNHFCQKLHLKDVKPKEGSIILNVTCSSITNVIGFWDSCIDGRAVEALSEVRDYYRRYFKCDTLEFDVILTKKGVSRCVNKIVEDLPSRFEVLIDNVTHKVQEILEAKVETPSLSLHMESDIIAEETEKKMITEGKQIKGPLVPYDENAILKSLTDIKMEENKPEYFYRLICLVVDLGTEVLLKIFKHEIKVSIKGFLKSKESKIKELKKGKILNDKQLKTLNQTNVDETKLDISLLYTLLRNLTDIQEPNAGWGACPAPSDKSPGALLIKLKDVRNEAIAHRAKGSLNKYEFEKFWKEASFCLVELAGGISSDERLEVQKKVDHCKTQPLLGDVESKVDALQKWRIDERHSELENKVDTLTDKVDKQDIRCQNYEKDISELREDIKGLKGVELKREMEVYVAEIIKALQAKQVQLPPEDPITNPNALTPDDILNYSEEIGPNWKHFASYLGFTTGQREILSETHSHKVDTICKKMLHNWHEVVARLDENPKELLALAFLKHDDRCAVKAILGIEKINEDEVRKYEPFEETKKQIRKINFEEQEKGDGPIVNITINHGGNNALNQFGGNLENTGNINVT